MLENIYKEVFKDDLIKLKNNEALLVITRGDYFVIYNDHEFYLKEYYSEENLNKFKFYKLTVKDHNLYYSYYSELITFSLIINYDIDYPVTFFNNNEVFSKNINDLLLDKYNFEITNLINKYLKEENIHSKNLLFKDLKSLENHLTKNLTNTFLKKDGISNIKIKINESEKKNEDSYIKKTINPFLI